MILNRLPIYFFSLLLLAVPLSAQRSLTRANIGIDYGSWKPSSIDDFPSQPLTPVDGADPYIGISFTTPVFKSHSLRFSAMQWRQENLEEVGLDAVTLRHLSADLKYYLLPEYTVSPYASYGVALIWSREYPLDKEQEPIGPNRAGWGFNLGAGVDFLLYKHLGMGIEYQYLYAVFNERVGLTSNYSGPKFSLKFYFIF